MNENNVIHFPVAKTHPGHPEIALMRHFACADCGKSGFFGNEPPGEGIHCALCGCDRWVEDDL